MITWETAKSTDSWSSWDANAAGPCTTFWGALLSTLNAVQFLQYQAFAISSLLTATHSTGKSQLMDHDHQAGSHALLRWFYLSTHHKAMQLQKPASTCIYDSKLPGDRNKTYLAHLLYHQCLAQNLAHT